MTRCIVCGIDETTGSRHAASIAARLARDLDSRALLVHVADACRRRASAAGAGREEASKRSPTSTVSRTGRTSA
jgi:hypothetical protein